MNKEEAQPGSLFIIYDSNKHPLDISRQGEGTSGFLEYMRSNMTAVLQCGHNPNLWMAHYEFPVRKDIPAIRPESRDHYLDLLADAAQRHGGKCVHTVNMADAFFCLKKDIIPLTPAAERSRLCVMEDYPDPMQGYGNNMPRPNIVLPEYRAYQALETETGVMLFSCTPEGERQRKAYELYHELHFYNPAQQNRTLRYHEIIADPFVVQGQVDRFGIQMAEGKDFKEAYTDPQILSQGHCLREMDLTPTIENYKAFCLRDDQQKSKKRLSDLTLSELLHRFTHPEPARENARKMECIQSRDFPGEALEITYKQKF